jgi:DNA-binding transcriptional regulator YiaG
MKKNRVREARYKARLSQECFAAVLGVSTRSVKRYEAAESELDIPAYILRQLTPLHLQPDLSFDVAARRRQSDALRAHYRKQD